MSSSPDRPMITVRAHTRAAPTPKPESLDHAIDRMRSQGYTNVQIAGEVRRWHPDWSNADIVDRVMPKRVPLPPSLNPKGDTRFTKPPPVSKVIPVRTRTPASTPSLEPVGPKHGASKRFYQPLRPGQKPSGYEAVGRRPGRAGIGSPVTSRPYWLATRGPTGDQGSQLSSAQLVKARQAGVHPTVAMALLTATTHPLTDLSRQAQGLRPFSPGGAASDVANIASNFAPVGKAAGVFGIGLRGLKGLRGAKAAVDVAEAARPLEQAEAKAALTTAEQVRTGLKGARSVRGKQEAVYSVERAKRARIDAIYKDTSLSVAEREHAADAVLRGALPKVHFGGLKDLAPETLDAMKTKVMEHPTLRGYDKKTVLKALTDAHAGEVPTNRELDLIETVFGKQTRDSLAKYAGETSKWKDAFFEVGNIPRSLQSSIDLSAVLRQGLGAATNHPIISARNLPGMIRATKNEDFFQQGLKNLAARPNAGKYDMGKLDVTDLGGIGKREEAFASNLAEKLTGLGKRERSPVRMSGRAYTYFLTHTRADIYDHYDKLFANAGYDVHDPEFVKGLSTMINSITGRGYSLGGLARGTSGKALNTVLFSPKLMASRFDLLNPVYYAKMPKGLRVLALRHSLATVGAIMSTLELARLAGLHVGLDPRSADFAKIKVGNTRIDLAGGYQQTVRMLYQVAVGQSKSSSTGQVVNLRSGKYGQKSVTDVLTSFFENKESPLASLASDVVLRGGKTTIGQKLTPANVAGTKLTPMLAQDLWDIYHEKHGGVNGLAWALGAAPLGALGVGLQTYPSPQPKVRGGVSDSGGNPLLRSSSSGGSNPLLRPSSTSGGGNPLLRP